MKFIIASYFDDEINPKHTESMIYLSAALHNINCEHDYYYADDREPIDKVKNEWVFNFLKTDATHIFMIHPSLSWDIRGMVRFLNIVTRGSDIVAGVPPNKFGGFGVNAKTKDNYILGKEGKNYRIIEVNSVVDSFIIYKREVFEQLKSEFSIYIKPSQYGEPEKEITKYFEITNLPGSESIKFQNILLQKYKIFVEPNITFSRIGKKNWIGNYNQFLLGAECML